MGPGVEAFAVYAVAALCSCAVSFVLGRHWPAAAQLDEAYDEGWEALAEFVWREHGIVAEVRAVRPADDPARPEQIAAGPEGWPDDMAGRRALPPAMPDVSQSDRLDVSRPGPAAAGTTGATGPGRLPSQDTYRAELARIGRPDPAPWYAALLDLVPVEPGPPAEPAWYERVLYREALEWGAVKLRHHEDQEIYHAHVDEWDRFIAAWGVEARWVTVGCRAWPPPGLVPA